MLALRYRLERLGVPAKLAWVALSGLASEGIPLPAPVPPTTYSVFIGKKQWKQVVESLKQPKDGLIVEGAQMLNAAGKTIVVFATKTTTRLLQQANRVAKPPT